MPPKKANNDTDDDDDADDGAADDADDCGRAFRRFSSCCFKIAVVFKFVIIEYGTNLIN